MHFLHSNPQGNVDGDRRANIPKMIDRSISCTDLLLHACYRMADTGGIAERPQPVLSLPGKPCIPSIFPATLGLGEWAGFLVRTGAGNAHGAKQPRGLQQGRENRAEANWRRRKEDR